MNTNQKRSTTMRSSPNPPDRLAAVPMLSRRDLFSAKGGATYRVLDVTVMRGKKVVHVFNMDEPDALPRQWPLEDLKEGLESGLYTKLGSRGQKVTITASQDSESEKKKSASEALRDWRYDLIKPLVNDERIYFRQHRGQLVAQRAKEADASKQTLMTCLRLYWRGGMTADALLAAFSNCGKPSDEHPTSETRGRKPRNDRYQTYRWKSEGEKRKVTATAARFFRKRKTNTRHFVYRNVVRTHYCVLNAEGKKVPLPLGERPTLTQVLYLLDKQLTWETVMRRKLGDDTFENDVAPKTGSARDYANGIAQYYEIDSTVPDVWICAEEDRSKVIGKSTLYLVVDVFSRLIVGFHLSLEAPSWSCAKEALVSIVADKEELCARWGLDHSPEDWVAHAYWPSFFRADRGSEMVGYDSDSIAEGLEGAVINTPPRKGPAKGTVECSFKLITVSLKDHVGGHTPSSDFRKRQIDNYKGEACRTFKEIGREILEAVILRNRKVHKGIKLPTDAVYAGLQPVPTLIWQRDLEERAGMLTQYDADYVRFKLLPSDTFTVTPAGVFSQGLLWVPPESEKAKWLLPAAKGHYSVTATFHRDLVDCIYVHDPKDSSRWTTMFLSDRSLQHAGKTFAEVAHAEDARLTLDELANEYNLALEIQHDQAAMDREKAARKLTQSAIDRASGRSRTTGATELRDQQARNERAKTRTLATTAHGSEPAPKSTHRTPQPVSATPPPSGPVSSNLAAASTAHDAFQALLNLRKNK